jgi:Mlc titration factor MtfA (ptsG expression regulator)
LSTPRGWLYTTPEAFKREGGQSGGNYDADKGCIQLALSQLYEGFYDKTPGVAPFLHEFGHMLDHFDSRGVLPGMHPDDGDIYTPEAREAFLKGKQLELERYLRLHERGYTQGDPLPIGHPYVFQNDGEFVAGYFEMFFRNPHYFADLNNDLYQGFALLFRQTRASSGRRIFPVLNRTGAFT